MQVIPAIYISEGKTVSLYKGIHSNEKTIYNKKPLEVAKAYDKPGINKIHIVDLDGSSQHKIIHIDLICNIIDKVDAEVQIAGGIRSMEEIDKLFKCGAARVILGYGAKNIFKEALSRYGAEKIIGGIKANKNIVDTDEELEKPLEVLHAGEEYKALGIQNIIFKDLESEGTFFPRFDEVDQLIGFTKLNIYLSGGISNENHLKILKEINTTGAIISRAFLEGKLSISKSLKIANS